MFSNLDVQNKATKRAKIVEITDAATAAVFAPVTNNQRSINSSIKEQANRDKRYAAKKVRQNTPNNRIS